MPNLLSSKILSLSILIASSALVNGVSVSLVAAQVTTEQKQSSEQQPASDSLKKQLVSSKAAGRPIKHSTRRKKTHPARKKAEPLNYQYGEVNVTVRGDNPSLIRLGLAYNSVLLVEFPAADKFFRWHGGNSKMVYIDDSPTKRNDNFIAVRAIGPNKENPNPFYAPVQLSIQMRSGLVVPFMVYPAKSTNTTTYRCVLRYNRDEVINARQKEGLAINVGGVEVNTLASNPEIKPALLAGKDLSIMSSASNSSKQNGPNESQMTPEPQTILNLEEAQPETNVKSDFVKAPDNSSDIVAAARNALGRALGNPKAFQNWTAPLHGLTISTVSQEIDELNKVVVVAVRNVNRETVRVMPDHPALTIQTFDDKAKPVQIEPVKKLHVEATTESNVLLPGATRYYAIAYKAPILGIKQSLQVIVGQQNAADEPASLNLLITAR